MDWPARNASDSSRPDWGDIVEGRIVRYGLPLPDDRNLANALASIGGSSPKAKSWVDKHRDGIKDTYMAELEAKIEVDRHAGARGLERAS